MSAPLWLKQSDVLSLAVDVDRRARFSSMCCWTLKQNVQDVFWLPRIPGDIIIPSLSFCPPPQTPHSPSPPLGLYVLLYIKYSLYSIEPLTYFGSGAAARALNGENSTLANTSRLSMDRLPLQIKRSLCFLTRWRILPFADSSSLFGLVGS